VAPEGFVTLTNFKSRNHPQQVGKRGADDATDDRRTPQDLFDALNAEFCFTLDAAASEANAKCTKFYTLSNSGLSESWRGERVWCNPPYSDCAAWVGKAWSEMLSGASLVVMLLPANRTEQEWWQSKVEPHRDGFDVYPRIRLRVRFLKGRIRFNRPGWTKPAKGDRPPFGLCLLIWERVG
jgi:phage N-6-adenine-methyltransferase